MTQPSVSASPSRRRWGIVTGALAALSMALVPLAVDPGTPAVAAPADGAVRTFDDEPLGEAPADCRIIGDVTVAEAAFGGAAETNQAMRVVDQRNDVYTRVWCEYPQSEERSVSYRFSPAQFDAGPYVAIQGAAGTSANGVWRFTFNRDGDDIRIDAYDGSSFATVATVAGGAALGEWVDVTINATTERAEIVVNGVRFETDRRNAPSPTMGEVYFGSAGAGPVGVDYYIDDLAVSAELPEDAFAGLEVEPIFDDEGLTRGAEVVDAPVGRFQLPEGASVEDYSAEVQWGDETIPAVLIGPDAEGWVTVSITHTFTRAGAGTLRTVVTDTGGVRSLATQMITVTGHLSELTFEEEEVGSLPPDCSTLSGYQSPAVSDELASEGAQSLRLHDTSATASVGLTCTTAAQEGAYLAFDIHPRSVQGLSIDIIGDSLRPTGQPANSLFRLAVRADGSIQWYEQWTASWREVAPEGTVTLGEWSRLELAVPEDDAAVRVSLDGEYIGTGGPTIGNNSGQHNEVTAITGIAMTTGANGAGPAVDDVFVDDITFGTPDITPPEAVGTAPFGLGEEVTVDDTGEQVGFPLGGIVFPTDDGGDRILIPYSGHEDAIDASGFLIGASDDGGASWFSGADLNPMPDASGITLTRLRNGDLISINYNAFMNEGTGNREALVETAVSSDGGVTWTQRAGTLTTPEPMRPIGTSSPRPGTTLAGFVLLHTLLEDPDGTLYMSAYGYYEGDARYRQVLLISHDGGIDWEVAGTVAEPDPELVDVRGYDGPSEGAVERLADGSLLMVMRTGWHRPMLYSRSTDDGATWSEPLQIEVGPAGQELYSVQPTMERLPSGELMLMVGRPGLVMTMSESGLGDDWSVPVGVHYANSENGSFTVLDPTTVVVAGDDGRVAPWRVWSRQTTVDPDCEQTISGAHDGAVTAGAGGLCLVDAEVDGDVTVADGGRLVVQDSVVTGDVSTDGASGVAICGTEVTGAVSLVGTSGFASVGDTTSGCASSTIDGSLTVSGTTGPVSLDRSTVTEDVTLVGNTSAEETVLAGITVDGNLDCTDNTAVPTAGGVPATVGGLSMGQCGDDEPPVDPVVVEPAAVTFADEAGTAEDTYTVPEVEGVEYVVGDEVVAAGTYPGEGTVTVTARAADGFELAEGATTEWSHTFDATEEPGPDPDPEPVPPTPGRGFYLNDGWGIWADHEFSYGRPGDQVLVGDWDGDGDDTLAVRRGNAYYLTNSLYGGDADVELTYGRASDTVLVGDWD
ncbi:MAG: sialidase family protein, partial [Actinomycetaceae bacterium]